MIKSEMLCELNDCLDEEYVSLKEGSIKDFQYLSNRKYNILESLADDELFQIPSDPDIFPKLIRNHTLAVSALRGMKGAIDRFDAVKKVALGLQTYSASGSHNSVGIRSASKMSKTA